MFSYAGFSLAVFSPSHFWFIYKNSLLTWLVECGYLSVCFDAFLQEPIELFRPSDLAGSPTWSFQRPLLRASVARWISFPGNHLPALKSTMIPEHCRGCRQHCVPLECFVSFRGEKALLVHFFFICNSLPFPFVFLSLSFSCTVMPLIQFSHFPCLVIFLLWSRTRNKGPPNSARL